jgi:hypothetical protein
MNLKELFEIVERYMIQCERNHTDPSGIQVMIPIKVPVSIGGTSCVDVKSAIKGFDWDNNKFLIHPGEDLSKTDHDYLAKIRKEAEEIGWDVYTIRNLKRENSRLLTELAKYNAE